MGNGLEPFNDCRPIARLTQDKFICDPWREDLEDVPPYAGFNIEGPATVLTPGDNLFLRSLRMVGHFPSASITW